MNQKENNLLILEEIRKYIEQPGAEEQRFGQILFNLNINVFADKEHPHVEKYQLRDIYNDSGEKILKRIKNENSK